MRLHGKRERWHELFAGFLLAAMVLILCSCSPHAEDVAMPATAQTDTRRQDTAQRCEAIAALIHGAADQPEAEQLLTGAGYCVITSDGGAPAYVANSAAFYDFIARAGQGTDVQQELLRVTDTGDLSYMCFSCEDGQLYYSSMRYCVSAGEESFAESFETHAVLDYTLTERGSFYFQLYPAGDKHYADYSRLRLEKPDAELYALTQRYVLPVGYKAVNLFLRDWQEPDFGAISFNDLLDALYFLQSGTRLDPEQWEQNGYLYRIPAEEFEAAVMPFFQIEQACLRVLARYDAQTGSYPYKPFVTNDAVWYNFPLVEPEVTACRENSDGTLTLTVDVASADLKTDRLFSHELRVRETEDGGFEYVANRIVYQTELGLPPDEARLDMAAETYG